MSGEVRDVQIPDGFDSACLEIGSRLFFDGSLGNDTLPALFGISVHHEGYRVGGLDELALLTPPSVGQSEVDVRPLIVVRLRDGDRVADVVSSHREYPRILSLEKLRDLECIHPIADHICDVITIVLVFGVSFQTAENKLSGT